MTAGVAGQSSSWYLVICQSFCQSFSKYPAHLVTFYEDDILPFSLSMLPSVSVLYRIFPTAAWCPSPSDRPWQQLFAVTSSTSAETGGTTRRPLWPRPRSRWRTAPWGPRGSTRPPQTRKSSGRRADCYRRGLTNMTILFCCESYWTNIFVCQCISS